MKRFIAIFLILSCLLPVISLHAEEPTGGEDIVEPVEPTYDSVIEISKNKDSINLSYELTPETTGTYYLFRVSPDNESIVSHSPIAQANAVNGKVSFTIEFDQADHSAALYGYVLALKTANGYSDLTEARYINNISAISHNSRLPIKPTTVKGLEVQYIADAQLIGVGQTVVHVKLNELISASSDESTAFVFGNNTYYVSNEALSVLDYRIKTLTDAGINVFINYILTFDSNADESLYYPEARGEADTIFAPNVSDFENGSRFAAVMHFIAERYSREGSEFGFCGNYIIGYEVNNVQSSHNSGKNDLASHAKEYAALLRFADIAIRCAYDKARIYASISNVWNAVDDQLTGVFGAKDLLTELATRIPDVDFGVAINPYPSDLAMTEFWLDEKATDDLETEYLTMKNLPVLNEFLNQKEMLCNGMLRSIVISEFGVSGKYGEESEKIQAAAYALAFYNASRLHSLEAFIWHRHVDHNYEIGLNYGLYSSSELTLERKDKKQIYNVFIAVDCLDNDSVKLIKSLLPLLPVKSYEELVKNTSTRTRSILTIKDVSVNLSSGLYEVSTLFDFSKSLYNFYPTDNTNYIEQLKEGKNTFMRIASLRMSPHEHMGAGANIIDGISVSGAEYLTVRVRINASCSKADFVLMFDGYSRGGRATLQFTSTVTTNEWVTLKFKVHGLTRKEISDARVKIWAKTETSNDEQIFIDVSSVQLHYEKNIAPFVFITGLVILGLISSGMALLYVLKHKKGRHHSRRRHHRRHRRHIRSDIPPSNI